MKEENLNFSIELKKYTNFAALSDELKELTAKAKEAALAAYAPYSKFKVGCSIKLNTGEIIKGNNQENACYPNGLCAERVALFNANSNFPNSNIEALAITIDYKNTDLKEPVFPCGACRQSILEYQDLQEKIFPIYLIGPDDVVYKAQSIYDLLPFTFSSNTLKTVV